MRVRFKLRFDTKATALHKGGLAPLDHESQGISDFFFKLQNGIGLKKKISLDYSVLKAVAVEVRIRTKCKIAFLYLSLMVTLSVVIKASTCHKQGNKVIFLNIIGKWSVCLCQIKFPDFFFLHNNNRDKNIVCSWKWERYATTETRK